MVLFLNYIDPGTGMILIQLIVAGVASVAVFFKNIREKLPTFLRKNERSWVIQRSVWICFFDKNRVFRANS